MLTRRANASTPSKLKKGDSDDEAEVYTRKVTAMQSTIEALKGKINAQEAELNSVKATLKRFTTVIEPYCMALEKRFAERIIETDQRVELMNKETAAKLEKLAGEIEVKFRTITEKADALGLAVKKDVSLTVSVAELQSSVREQEIGQAGLKSDLSEALEKLKAVQQEAMSYKAALKAGVSTSASQPVHVNAHTPPATPATRCIIKTPRGYIQGAGAANRAKSFNTKVLAKLTKLDGHFTLPEATGLVLIEPKEGMPVYGDMWLAYFASASDVTKLFAYKSQLKNVCPDVYVQPDLPREIRMQRKLLVFGAKQFVKNQAAPNSWRFKWVDNLKIMITGPADAQRYVVMDEGVAKVVYGGQVKVSATGKGKERTPGKKNPVSGKLE